MFGFKQRNARIDDFGIKLANEVANRVPPGTGTAKKGNEKYAKAIDYALSLTIAFQRDNRLGVYGKARLFNSFKWQLKQLGYPDDFVDQMTAALVNLAAARRPG